MEILLLDDAGKQKYSEQILSLCQISDGEFVPPLSQRSSTTQATLTGGPSDGVMAYFREVMKQSVLACTENGKLLGFVSFKENYVPEHYPDTKLPNIYVSTLILFADSRGRGLTKKIYSHLFYERFPERSIYTRTWSANAAHIKILDHFGFSECLCIPNHRGIGIDTVYYEIKR
jgi:L-amino acid N-acyltransferase YncA